MAEVGKDAHDRRAGGDRRNDDRRKVEDPNQIPLEGDRRKGERRRGDRRD